MKAIRLKTADLTDPRGIDVLKPRLSWNCSGGITQTAYQVTAYSADHTLLFDTGKVESSQMHCIYAGKKLESRMEVFWQVCLWDENGKEEDSDTAVFEMGLLDSGEWSAKWICGIDTEKAERLPADYYKKTFSVGENLIKARLYLTSHGVYTAKINGVSVGNVLAPGTTEYGKRLYYQTYDVTEHLQENQDNELLLCVGDGWYKGKLGADQEEYLFGTQTKVFGQLELTYKGGKMVTIATDETFLWSNDGPIRFTDLKDGEIYDATKRLTFCEHARISGETMVPTASNAPAIKEQEKFPARLEIAPSGAKILNFGQNIAGYIRFRTDAPKGTVIRIRMFEATDHGEYSDASLSFPNGNVEPVKQEIIYTASGKEEEFQPEFFYSGFQYALVEGLENVNPEDFTAVAVYSDLEYGGSFTCSNPMLNQFFSNTLWSMKGNFVDVPTDCPQREKAGWTGDAQVFCKTATYLADTKAFYRKWFRDIKDCQRENGLVEDVNPRVGRLDSQRAQVSGSCGWADAAVIIPYTLWKQTGDASVIEESYEVMSAWKRYITELCQNKTMFQLPDGHPLKQIYERFRLEDSPWNQYIPEAGVHWGEWCVPESQEPKELDDVTALIAPKQEVTCAYTSYSMRLLEEMLRFAGKEKEAEECRRYAEGSCQAYHTHWVKDGKICTGHMAELVRPIALGLLTEEEVSLTANALNKMVIDRDYKVGTGFLSTPFLLQVLAENGYLETAYRMLENEQAPGWLAMVAQGATTVWEEYECYSENGNPLPHSFNHYSPGAVCTFLFDTVCGIRVGGENRIVLSPKPGGTLAYAEAKTVTAYGEVVSRWERKDGKIEYYFEIPANTEAEIVFPDGAREVIRSGSHHFK